MKICIYGASSNTINNSYITKTEELARALAKAGHSLVFGGGQQGLMGASARGFYAENAEIIGVAPSFFNIDGILFGKCTEFIYTETMRERKQIMEDKSDAFIVLPGGIGTFEEFFEIFTLKQLSRHSKPIVIYNINGYYDDLISSIKKAVSEEFMKSACLDLYAVFDCENDVLDYLNNYDYLAESVEKYKNI